MTAARDPAALRPHPLADLLPAMTDAGYAELRESIDRNGLREPITLHRDGRIIDGRHRAQACAELGLPVASRMFDGADADLLTFVLDANVKRRHLNESQRAMVAARLAARPHGGNRTKSPIGDLRQADAAGLLNVGKRSVERARAVLDRAVPEIVAAVEQGQMPVSQGAQVARLPAARQQQVAADMDNGRSLLTTVLAHTRADRVDLIERASTAVPLSALGRTFPVLYADPPWQFQSWSAGGMQKAAEMHYPTLPVADICALPVADIAADNAVLFMWGVPALFPEALSVVAAWGFTFKTFAVWIKNGPACGHWFRGKHEPLIVATRGAFPPPPRLRESVFAEDAFTGSTSGAHSEKPASVRDWIAEAYPGAGKIELFGRSTAPGWTTWGHEAPAQMQAREGGWP